MKIKRLYQKTEFKNILIVRDLNGYFYYFDEKKCRGKNVGREDLQKILFLHFNDEKEEASKELYQRYGFEKV